ncbi:MAG: hypothetical protein ACLFUB_09125 [Cyclobacteriaceae bacterium]
MATPKSRNILLLISVLLALLAVFIQFGIIVIPGLTAYKFWILMIAYGIVLAVR